MNNVNHVIFTLSILSFCMSFSGSFITFVKTSNVFHFNSKEFAMIKAFADGFGYLSRILVGIMIDKIKRRKPFLIIGYAPVVFLKLLMIFVFSNFLSDGMKIIIFILTDVIDLSLNASRDISRDSYIADMCVNDKSLLTRALNIRKSISLFGTAFGLIFFSTYYYLYPYKNISYLILSIIAMLVSAVGVGVLLTRVKEHSQSILQSTGNIDFLNIMKNGMWLGFLALFLVNITKPNHYILFSESSSIIQKNYPQYIKYGIFIQTSLFPIFYYICGAISSFVLSRFSFNTIFIIFTSIAGLINIIHFNYIKNINSLLFLILLNILYGFYNNVFDNILNTLILNKATKNKIYTRGTVLAVSNIIMALSNLLLGSLLAYLKYDIFTIIKYGSIINLIGLLFIVFIHWNDN